MIPMSPARQEDVPFSLRRSRRASVGRASYREVDLRSSLSSPRRPAITAVTPRKSTKRVRFSDPGLIRSPSTGLTPIVRRASLASTPKRRRISHTISHTPSRSPGAGISSSPLSPSRYSSTPSIYSPRLPESGEVTFLPLRQVLGGRIQRRLRRNGLSEEMNRISEAKRARQRKAKEEVERLRSEVKDRDEEIYRLQNETMVVDTQRVWELEKEVRQLKERLVQKGGVMGDEGRSTRETTVEVGSEMGNESQYEWTLAARDPFNNEYSDMGVDDDSIDIDSIDNNEDSAMDLHMPMATTFGDASMADIASSTPVIKQKPSAPISTESSFLSPPATSPAATPKTLLPVRFDRMLPTPKSASRLRYSTTTAATQADIAALTVEIGAQADMPDPEKQLLEEQMQSMRREMTKLNATIDTYESLGSRLGAKLDAALPSSPEGLDEDVEQRLTRALQELSDRTSAIHTLSTSLSQLGFAGGDAFDVVASISGAFRAARLELEYLTPGEITLPLSASGAQVLDLMLTRLRDLAKRVKEADDSIDEYHSLELSLRQQLGARAEAMEKDAIERDSLKERLGERDERVAELEVSVSRLRGAVEGYERDIHELEVLVERMEGEGNELRSEVHAREQAEREKQQLIASLEEHVAMMEAEAKKLAEAKDEAERRRVEDIAAMSRDHSVVVAARDIKIEQLREEVKRLNAKLSESLENTQARFRSLKEEKRAADREKDRAKRVMQEMQAQLQRVMIMGSSFLNSEMEGVQQKMEKEADDEMAGMPSGRYAKRRRFDSGIGVDEEEEDELAA